MRVNAKSIGWIIGGLALGLVLLICLRATVIHLDQEAANKEVSFQKVAPYPPVKMAQCMRKSMLSNAITLQDCTVAMVVLGVNRGVITEGEGLSLNFIKGTKGGSGIVGNVERQILTVFEGWPITDNCRIVGAVELE